MSLLCTWPPGVFFKGTLRRFVTMPVLTRSCCYITRESILNSWLGINIYYNVLQFASPRFKNPFPPFSNSHNLL